MYYDVFDLGSCGLFNFDTRVDLMENVPLEKEDDLICLLRREVQTGEEKTEKVQGTADPST